MDGAVQFTFVSHYNIVMISNFIAITVSTLTTFHSNLPLIHDWNFEIQKLYGKLNLIYNIITINIDSGFGILRLALIVGLKPQITKIWNFEKFLKQKTLLNFVTFGIWDHDYDPNSLFSNFFFFFFCCNMNWASSSLILQATSFFKTSLQTVPWVIFCLSETASLFHDMFDFIWTHWRSRGTQTRRNLYVLALTLAVK